MMNIFYKLKKKIENVNFKKLIILIFFFLPGGFILLSIMMFVNEFLIKKNPDESDPD